MFYIYVFILYIYYIFLTFYFLYSTFSQVSINLPLTEKVVTINNNSKVKKYLTREYVSTATSYKKSFDTGRFKTNHGKFHFRPENGT